MALATILSLQVMRKDIKMLARETFLAAYRQRY
jgi:hypothetical protein